MSEWGKRVIIVHTFLDAADGLFKETFVCLPMWLSWEEIRKPTDIVSVMQSLENKEWVQTPNYEEILKNKEYSPSGS